MRTAFTLLGISLSLLSGAASRAQPLSAEPARIIEGTQPNGFLGRSVASAGDVNGDGYDDVIVGARGNDAFTGRVWIYLGSPSGLASSPDWTVPGPQAGARFGDPVAFAGDVNGDGYEDVLVGAAYHDVAESDEGRALLFLGGVAGPSTDAAWVVEGEVAGELLGSAVASAGDVNGDGFDDVLVGASGFRNGELSEGRALLFLGSATGLAQAPSWTAEGNRAGARFGSSVASAGDVNADGFDDVVVGAESYSNGETWEGLVFLYLGSPGGLALEPATILEIDQADAKLGSSLASAGDVDGDGHDDVLVGAVYYDDGEHDEGGAFLFLGTVNGLSTTAAWSGEADQEFASFGHSVASAGDVNRDGYDDVVIGAVLYDDDLIDQGRVDVYLGSASGLSEQPAWRSFGEQSRGQFGYAVAPAGDVNGDGHADLVVGADRHDGPETDGGAAFVFHGAGSRTIPAPGRPGRERRPAGIGVDRRSQDLQIE